MGLIACLSQHTAMLAFSNLELNSFLFKCLPYHLYCLNSTIQFVSQYLLETQLRLRLAELESKLSFYLGNKYPALSSSHTFIKKIFTMDNIRISYYQTNSPFSFFPLLPCNVYVYNICIICIWLDSFHINSPHNVDSIQWNALMLSLFLQSRPC